MTTNIFTAAPTNTADADFRAWGSGLRAALTAVGLVRTADTGQIDWTTVTRPVGPGLYQGYEIWRFNDTLQATAPLFLKVEYGSGSVSGGIQVGMRWQLGKGSNGSGSLTTPIGPATTTSAPSSSATVTNWYVSSGDGSMLAIVISPSTATVSNRGYLLVERSRDTSGVATATAVVISGPTNQISPRNYASTGGVLNPPFLWPASIPADATVLGSTLTAGGSSPMFQPILSDGAGNYWQPLCVLTYLLVDVASLASVTIPGLGTYMPMGNGMSGLCSTGGSYCCGAIAWY